MKKLDLVISFGLQYVKRHTGVGWYIIFLQSLLCVLQVYNKTYVEADFLKVSKRHLKANIAAKHLYTLINIIGFGFIYFNQSVRRFQSRSRNEICVTLLLLSWFALSINIIYPMYDSLLTKNNSVWLLILSPFRTMVMLILFILGLPFTIQPIIMFEGNDDAIELGSDIKTTFHVSTNDINLSWFSAITPIAFFITSFQIVFYDIIESKVEINDKIVEENPRDLLKKHEVAKILKCAYCSKPPFQKLPSKDKPCSKTFKFNQKQLAIKTFNIIKPLNAVNRITPEHKNLFQIAPRLDGLTVGQLFKDCKDGLTNFYCYNVISSYKMIDLIACLEENKFCVNPIKITSKPDLLKISSIKDLENEYGDKISYDIFSKKNVQCSIRTTNEYVDKWSVRKRCEEKSVQRALLFKKSFTIKLPKRFKIDKTDLQHLQSTAIVIDNMTLSVLHDNETICYSTTPDIGSNHSPEHILLNDSNFPQIKNRNSILFPEVKEKESQTEIIFNKKNTKLQSNFDDDIMSLTNSVTAMSGKSIEQTESIRLKVSKSQHGLWYASLRGDVFLAVSLEILHNRQPNRAKRKEVFISEEIIKKMKIFVSKHNELSSCFNHENDSEDESFINGFRL